MKKRFSLGKLVLRFWWESFFFLQENSYPNLYDRNDKDFPPGKFVPTFLHVLYKLIKKFSRTRTQILLIKIDKVLLQENWYPNFIEKINESYSPGKFVPRFYNKLTKAFLRENWYPDFYNKIDKVFSGRTRTQIFIIKMTKIFFRRTRTQILRPRNIYM